MSHRNWPYLMAAAIKWKDRLNFLIQWEENTIEKKLSAAREWILCLKCFSYSTGLKKYIYIYLTLKEMEQVPGLSWLHFECCSVLWNRQLLIIYWEEFSYIICSFSGSWGPSYSNGIRLFIEVLSQMPSAAKRSRWFTQTRLKWNR